MGGLLSDIRYAARSLGQRPGFVTVAVLTLALGIGANTVIFSLVHGVLFAPLPFREPEELVIVWENDRHNQTQREGASAPDFFDFQERSTSFEGLVAFRTLDLNLTGTDEPQRLQVAGVSHDLFALLGIVPEAGRSFLATEDRPGGEPVAILSHGLWQRRFASDPGVVGESLLLNNRAHTVVGVMPPGRGFPEDVDLWVPLNATIETSREMRGVHNLLVLGRLRDGIALEQAQAEMTDLARALEQEYPDDNASRGIFLEPLHEAVVRGVRPALSALMGAVVFVLLIACTNVANLLLVRASTRGAEMALRTTLGASRWRLARHAVTESLLLAAGGAGAGLLLAFWGLDAALALSPESVPRLGSVAIDRPVLAFTAFVSLAVGLLLGLVPVLQGMRIDLTAALKSRTAQASASRRRRRFQTLLVAGEAAVAVVLLVSAGLLIQSFWRLLRVEPGFDADNLLTVQLRLPDAKYAPDFSVYPHWPAVVAFTEELIERVGALPGVEAVALAHNHPLAAGWTSRIFIQGRPQPPLDKQDEVRIRQVSWSYFRTVSIPLLRGRQLSPRDRLGAPNVVLINEALARRYFPDEDPLGQSLEFWGESRRIVGVVRDVRFLGLARQSAAAIYPPLLQVPQTFLTLLVRTHGEPTATVPSVREAIWAVDPDLALFDIATMESRLASSVSQPRFNMLVFSLFAAAALLLATLGVFGVMSYAVSERTHEIGIRMALGARSGEILRAVIGHGMLLALAATAAGTMGALVASRLLSGLLFEVDTGDPVTFVAAVSALLLTVLLACYVPARRAAGVDPAVALRHQ